MTVIDRPKAHLGVYVRSLSLIFLLSLLRCAFCSLPASGEEGGGEEGCFLVTGHILNKKVEVGINQEFLREAVPFINRIHPDFLVLAGDMTFGEGKTADRLPIEIIEKQYSFLVQSVFSKIESKIYCLAGNHDIGWTPHLLTGWTPHLPSVELFERVLNPLHFSFEHKGSLFLFLSLCQPFYHLDRGFLPLFKNFNTPASQSFLADLRSTCLDRYEHIFVFVHISPLSDYPNGYYWTQFLLPFFSTLKQDIYIFSTDQYNRNPFGRQVNQVAKYHKVRFYCFASFPRGAYLVHFNGHKVKVDIFQGSTFVPSSTREIDFQPTTRLSMIRRYLSFLFTESPQGIVMYFSFKYFGKRPGAVVRDYCDTLMQRVNHYFGTGKESQG